MKIEHEEVPKDRTRYLPLILVAVVFGLLAFGILDISLNIFTLILDFILKRAYLVIFIVLVIYIFIKIKRRKKK